MAGAASPRIKPSIAITATGDLGLYSLLSGQASNPYYTLQSIKAGVTRTQLPFSIDLAGQGLANLDVQIVGVLPDCPFRGTLESRRVNVNWLTEWERDRLPQSPFTRFP